MTFDESNDKYKSVDNDLIGVGRSIIWAILGFGMVILILIGFIISEVKF